MPGVSGPMAGVSGCYSEPAARRLEGLAGARSRRLHGRRPKQTTSPAHMLARTPVEHIVVSWICKLVYSFFFLSVAGVGNWDPCSGSDGY